MATKAAKKKVVKKAGAKRAGSSAGVILLVNGTSQGAVQAGEGETIQTWVDSMARSSGLKAFTVRVNGKIIVLSDAAKQLKGVKSLEIFAKDTRGSR